MEMSRASCSERGATWTLKLPRAICSATTATCCKAANHFTQRFKHDVGFRTLGHVHPEIALGNGLGDGGHAFFGLGQIDERL